MKKLLNFILLFHLISVSQTDQDKLETIYVNNTQNVLIYFDSGIVQGIPGHSNFKFAFDLENKSKFGIIRGTKNIKSNLHIITDDGNVYSFHLEYKSKLTKYNYFIKPSSSVGNVNGNIKEAEKSELVEVEVPSSDKKNTNDVKESTQHKKDSIILLETTSQVNYKKPERDEGEILYNTNREEFYRKFCGNIQYKSTNIKRVYIENENVILYLRNIIYNRNELYFHFRLKNNSGVDYNVNFEKFSKLARKKNKNASSQSVTLDYIFSSNKFSEIPAGEYQDAIYVFKKFGINKKKKIVLEINELKGERNLSLEIDSRYINK